MENLIKMDDLEVPLFLETSNGSKDDNMLTVAQMLNGFLLNNSIAWVL